MLLCRISLRCLHWGSESVSTQMHHVDLRYTKEELLLIFDQATKEDVDRGGHYDCRGGAIHIWSHPWCPSRLFVSIGMLDFCPSHLHSDIRLFCSFLGLIP